MTAGSEPFDLADPALRLRAAAAARGSAPFDRLVAGGVRRDADIGFVGPLNRHAARHAAGRLIPASSVRWHGLCPRTGFGREIDCPWRRGSRSRPPPGTGI